LVAAQAVAGGLLPRQDREPRAEIAPKDAVHLAHRALELLRVGHLRDVKQATLGDQTRERANRKSGAAETEQEDPVSLVVDARQLAVELADVSAQAEPGRASHDLDE